MFIKEGLESLDFHAKSGTYNNTREAWENKFVDTLLQEHLNYCWSKRYSGKFEKYKERYEEIIQEILQSQTAKSLIECDLVKENNIKTVADEQVIDLLLADKGFAANNSGCVGSKYVGCFGYMGASNVYAQLAVLKWIQEKMREKDAGIIRHCKGYWEWEKRGILSFVFNSPNKDEWITLDSQINNIIADRWRIIHYGDEHVRYGIDYDQRK